MEEDFDRLTAALRVVAVEDGLHAPLGHDERIAVALSSRRRQLSPSGRVAGLALAATLAMALVGTLWVASSLRLPPAATVAPDRGEIRTAFMPLMYSGVPYTDAQIVRLEVPRGALEQFGLSPAELSAEMRSAVPEATVLADVIVGEDGLARAVRFVRAERAPGVAP